MSKVKVNLETAKKILETEKIFINNKNQFNYVDAGKYNSGFTIVIPQEWNMGLNNEPTNPIKYIECKELTGGMNLDFDGETNVLLGKYRLSQNGKNVFEITEPTKAKDAMISVKWGGPFNTTRGQSYDYAKESGATAFVKSGSNGGGAGADYWIVPVDYVKGMEKRDVSEILKNIQKSEEERISKIDEILSQREKEKQDSINNKERILKSAEPIVNNIKEYNKDFNLIIEEDTVKFKGTNNYTEPKRRYNDNVLVELNNILEKEIKIKNSKDEFEPKFKELENVLKELNLDITYYKINVEVQSLSDEDYDNYKYYNYDESSYNNFVNDINAVRTKMEEEKKEARRKAEELKKKMELDKLKEEAKEKGYPEEFSFFNRLYGKINLSHAYVIDKDGSIREPDDNILNNKNHSYKYQDWLNDADGTQVYNQIYEGEVIVSYTKENSSTPYVVNVEWTDGQVNETQIETICNSLELINYDDNAIVDIYDNKVESIREWAEIAIKEKSKECRETLNLEEIEEQDLTKLQLVKENENNTNKLLDEYKKLLTKITEAKQLDKEVIDAIKELEEKSKSIGE